LLYTKRYEKKSMKKLAFILLFILPFFMFSQQLKYKPVNPAFGGDTFNYQWLLNSAEAQNSFTDPNDNGQGVQQTELERFTESLNRQLLGQISRTLINDKLGDGELAPGTFTLGSLEVEIYDSTEGLVVNILDVSTGDQTQIIIPN
jgi:curli production assembly/transport component CsgF